jgi:hypothetical protein
MTISTNRFRKGDRIRTTYEHSHSGRIVRYTPIPSRGNPGTMMEWYRVRFDDGTGATIHADMMNRRNNDAA